jgi:hypothetical protein
MPHPVNIPSICGLSCKKSRLNQQPTFQLLQIGITKPISMALVMIDIREKICVDCSGNCTNKLAHQLIEAPSTCGKSAQKCLLHFEKTSECFETGIDISRRGAPQFHRAVARVCIAAAHQVVVNNSWTDASTLRNHVPKVDLIWSHRDYRVGPLATWPKAG